MPKTVQIRINEAQHKAIKLLKDSNNMPTISHTIDFLIKNQKRLQTLEKLKKNINLLTSK